MKNKAEPLTESYFYILLCLAKEDSHGYGIMRDTLEMSNKRVKIGSGTMYGATGNMIKKGWIQETNSHPDGYERKRMYRLTNEGKEVLLEEVKRINGLLENAVKILGNVV